MLSFAEQGVAELVLGDEVRHRMALKSRSDFKAILAQPKVAELRSVGPEGA